MNSCIVTPCMGVWIETVDASDLSNRIKSHPVWVCGLKLVFLHVLTSCHTVTPCMGVWIETELSLAAWASLMSHPVWVCGLKHSEIQRDSERESHTLYGCVD